MFVAEIPGDVVTAGWDATGVGDDGADAVVSAAGVAGGLEGSPAPHAATTIAARSMAVPGVVLVARTVGRVVIGTPRS
jgi:hypothetical protein